MTVTNLGPCGCCGGTITTVCCPDNAIPKTLHGVISGMTGDCACANGPFDVTYNPAVDGWEILFPVCGDATNPCYFRVACIEGGWVLFSNDFFPDGSPLGGTSCDATTSDCDPFSLVFSPMENAANGDPTPGSIFIGRSCAIGALDAAQVTIFA